MKKIAIFVEGQTELLFVERMLAEFSAQALYSVELYEVRGGSNAQRSIKRIGFTTKAGTKLYCQILDCGGEGGITSAVNDQYSTMISSGFTSIIVLRDVYPRKVSDAPIIKEKMMQNISSSVIAPNIILAILELEAWFFAEHSHFTKIDPKLNSALVLTHLRIDPTTVSPDAIPKPADTLRSSYRLVGKTYNKKKSTAKRTIQALDYSLMRSTVGPRSPELTALISEIDSFFA